MACGVEKEVKIKVGSQASFLLYATKLVLVGSRQTFIQVPILYHFIPERHIYIKINSLRYVIRKLHSLFTP